MKQALRISLQLISLWLLLWLSGCAAEPPPAASFDNCLYGVPEAIFDESLPGLSQHHFELAAGKGVEKFVLDGDILVRIEQTGCDHLEQQFTFSWEGGFSGTDSAYWVQKSIELFGALGQLGAPYLSFSAISNALKQHRNKLQPDGKSISLQPGLNFRLTSGKQSGKMILTATLYESTVKPD